eukprot:3234717-Amphidinium_carterae.1
MYPHEVLGVPLGAPPDVVRAAYKRAALESHPDKGGSKDPHSRVMLKYLKFEQTHFAEPPSHTVVSPRMVQGPTSVVGSFAAQL